MKFFYNKIIKFSIIKSSTPGLIFSYFALFVTLVTLWNPAGKIAPHSPSNPAKKCKFAIYFLS